MPTFIPVAALALVLAAATPAAAQDDAPHEGAPPATDVDASPSPPPAASTWTPPRSQPMPARGSLVSTSTNGRPARVFFSRIVVSDGASAAEASIIADAILVAAKKRKGFDVVGTTDLQGVLDVEATKAASGCDTVSCASELADALDAPQLVTAQLGRVGRTWVLTLNRIERSTLRVLAREQAQRAGDAADAILRDVPDVVARLLPAPDTNADGGAPLLAIGGATAAAGVVAAAIGGLFVGASLQIYEDGESARLRGEADTAAKARDDGEPLYYAGWIGVITGGVLAVGGGALALVDVMGAE